MKELSIEEKAKRYDEAIEKAKTLYENANGMILKKWVEQVFPELKESEDKRIRKDIVSYLALYKDAIGEEYESWIAWLEKQGKNNMGISEATKQKLEDNLNKALEKETAESFNEFLDGQGEQKPVEWSEEDEKIKEGLINSLARISVNTRTDSTSINYTFSKEIDWLKSLRPQKQWKPSGFHLECISDAIIMYKERGINAIGLKEILEELKKLRERQSTENT